MRSRTRRSRRWADADELEFATLSWVHWFDYERLGRCDHLPPTEFEAAFTTRVLRDVVLCVDQSGSMASSVVYASVFGSVLASVRRCGPA